MGVNEDQAAGKEIGAGDQGLMFGYACNDTPELMPLPIALAHRILNRLTAARFNEEVPWLRPDSKSQVTVEYDGHRPVRIDTVVVSTQHCPERQPGGNPRVCHRARSSSRCCRAELINGDDHLSHQSHGAIRRRRAAGRLRPDRAQDHRRYLRRLGPARRRGVQRQGPHQGRSQRGLHGPPRRQEHRGRRAGRALRSPVGLCHRRLRAGQRAGRYRRDRRIDDERLCELVRELFPLTPGGIIEYLDLRRPIYR